MNPGRPHPIAAATWLAVTCLATAAFGLEAPDATVTHTIEPTYKVRVEALTDFPVQLGVGAAVRVARLLHPRRLRAGHARRRLDG